MLAIVWNMAATVDSPEIFNNLSSKITQLLYGRSENDRNLINKSLDELNSLNYKYPIVTNTAKAVLLINQCCSLIPPEDSELVIKCCDLITSLIMRQNVVVEGRTQKVAVQWSLHALSTTKSEGAVLAALEALLHCKTDYDLVGEVVKCVPLVKIARNKANLDGALAALQCLEASTSPLEDVKLSDKFPQEFQICFDIFMDYLQNYNSVEYNLVSIKILTVCLRGLQNIIIDKPHLLQDNLGLTLGVIKSYMLFDIKGVDFLPPTKLLPAPLSIPEPNTAQMKKGGKVTKQRKTLPQANASKIMHEASYTPANHTLEDSHSRLKTSDSDFSDTEGGNLAKLTLIAGRVRQAALILFLHTIKLAEKSVIFAYWSSFIPENPTSGRHNLLTCLLKDPSARGRMAVLNVLLQLLSSSKLFLAQAEKGDNLSFTPFSMTIGLMIKELHRCLSLALCENYIPVLVQILKCFAALVQSSPYHRLEPGLISKIVRNIKEFIYHKDPTVQVSALIVFGCILSSEPVVPETLEALNKQQTEDDVPWLLSRCLHNLGIQRDNVEIVENSNSTAVKLESLQILSAMSRNYFHMLLVPHLPLVTRALEASLACKYADVRLHAGRTVDFIGQAGPNCDNFWQILINSITIGLLQDEQHPVLRAIGCDCIGSIGAVNFDQLPQDQQILCVTLLFAATRDEENSVKGAAIRALAICLLYPSLRGDMGFVVDTAEAIYRVLQDENQAVRIKASWSLGNLSEAFVLNQTSNPNYALETPQSLLLKLFKTTNNASRDNDRIKMNTVRALGNFLQLVTLELIENPQFNQAIRDGIEILVNNCNSGSNMKVRWNSCYALSNAMKNSVLFSLKIPWQEKVFTSLSDLVVNFRNFKVRINAAVALATPQSRDFYGDYYQHIWFALVKGLETAQYMDDFSEYKHRDNLIEQICITLAHLVTLLLKTDLPTVHNCLQSDQIKVHVHRILQRLVPEKASVFLEASQHISQLTNDITLNREEKEILRCLNEIFHQQIK